MRMNHEMHYIKKTLPDSTEFQIPNVKQNPVYSDLIDGINLEFGYWNLEISALGWNFFYIF